MSEENVDDRTVLTIVKLGDELCGWEEIRFAMRWAEIQYSRIDGTARLQKEMGIYCMVNKKPAWVCALYSQPHD
jgi:hypothetical protein